MSYQLVLQFAGDSLASYDEVIAIENRLISGLGESADVDGHDCGQGESNIFIRTDAPMKTFQQVRLILAYADYLGSVSVGYRNVNDEEYAVLWPENFAGRFTVS